MSGIKLKESSCFHHLTDFFSVFIFTIKTMLKMWIFYFSLLIMDHAAQIVRDGRLREIEAGTLQCYISTLWNGHYSLDIALARIKLIPEEDHVVMEITARYFNDTPVPFGDEKSFDRLWEYEVVEAFFLGKDEKYLEVEFSPHGYHLVLLLSGKKNAIKKCLPVEYTAKIIPSSDPDTIYHETWKGVAKIPKSYFPPKVTHFNAYAIHGTVAKNPGDERIYEALYPDETRQFSYPDFHRLEFFQEADFEKILGSGDELSDVWKTALEEKEKAEAKVEVIGALDETVEVVEVMSTVVDMVMDPAMFSDGKCDDEK